MTCNCTNRKISALLFCALLATNMPLFCPASQNGDEVELSGQDDVEAALIPKEVATERPKKLFALIGRHIAATTTAVRTSISNNATRIAKTVGYTCLALLVFTAGGFATYEVMKQPPATLNLNPVAPCTIHKNAAKQEARQEHYFGYVGILFKCFKRV